LEGSETVFLLRHQILNNPPIRRLSVVVLFMGIRAWASKGPRIVTSMGDGWHGEYLGIRGWQRGEGKEDFKTTGEIKTTMGPSPF